MPIDFTCHNCGQQFHAPEQYAGGKARCKNCGTTVLIPRAQGQTSSPQSEAARRQQPPSPANAKSSDSIEVVCPKCKKQVIVELHGMAPDGKLRVTCNHCGADERLSAYQKELWRQVAALEKEHKRQARQQEKEEEEKRAERRQRMEEPRWAERKIASLPPSASATVTPTPGRVIPAARPHHEGDSEVLGWILIGTPAVATFLIWFWVGNMNLLQNPDSSLALLVAGTVVLTSILMAVEAGQLGIGRIEINGKRGTSPAGWFFGGLLLWIICYPVYLHMRRRYGVASRLMLGLVVAVVFLGSTGLMGAAIEARKAEVRQAFSGVSDSLRDLGETLGGPSEVSSPARSTPRPTKSFDIVDIDMRRTSSNEFMVEVGWKVVLRSTTNESKRYAAHIKFLDENKFVVSQDIQVGLILSPYETETFTFEAMMTPAEWSEVERYEVEVEEF